MAGSCVDLRRGTHASSARLLSRAGRLAKVIEQPGWRRQLQQALAWHLLLPARMPRVSPAAARRSAGRGRAGPAWRTAPPAGAPRQRQAAVVRPLQQEGQQGRISATANQVSGTAATLAATGSRARLGGSPEAWLPPASAGAPALLSPTDRRPSWRCRLAASAAMLSTRLCSVSWASLAPAGAEELAPAGRLQHSGAGIDMQHGWYCRSRAWQMEDWHSTARWRVMRHSQTGLVVLPLGHSRVSCGPDAPQRRPAAPPARLPPAAAAAVAPASMPPGVTVAVAAAASAAAAVPPPGLPGGMAALAVLLAPAGAAPPVLLLLLVLVVCAGGAASTAAAVAALANKLTLLNFILSIRLLLLLLPCLGCWRSSRRC